MLTLGIETSCDETAASVVEKRRVLSNVVSSSVGLHSKYGGVIPEIASRFHVEYINRVTKKALAGARKSLGGLKLVAFTERPGLSGSLLTGGAFAKAIGYSLRIPVIGVNHLEAHIYANFLVRKAPEIEFPFLAAVISGGHTNIFICRSLKRFEVIGRTRDDAVGEAFDKVAKILGAGYPGGPRIEKLAGRAGFSRDIDFPRVYLEDGSFDFSLSGIKTAVLYYVKARRRLSSARLRRVCWSFQEAVFDVVTERIVRAAREFRLDRIFLGGGVISNNRLRKKLSLACRNSGYKLFYPPRALCVDNAAMVAGLGEALYAEKWSPPGLRTGAPLTEY